MRDMRHTAHMIWPHFQSICRATTRMWRTIRQWKSPPSRYPLMTTAPQRMAHGVGGQPRGAPNGSMGAAAGKGFGPQFALSFPLRRREATLILSWHVPAHGRGTTGRPTSACLHALILATGCCCSTGGACFGGTCLTRCGVHGAGDGAELLPSRTL